MKIDRRCFLSLGIGAAAGTALSPLPWKITDDLSIWTQNWPWTPVPEDGAAHLVTSTCMLCPGGCGISVRKIDNRAVKIEGAKGHPINDGGICMLGLSGLQLLYGPSRIQTPLKRTGPRGEGKFVPITWKAAIKELAGKLSLVRAEGEAHKVACISGSRSGTVAALLKRLLTACGSPNFLHVPSVGDTYAKTVKVMHGTEAEIGVDVENADFLLSFSSGILDGWGSPVRMFRANSRIISRGGRTVQIEPRLSNSAAKADQWIAITPGTEAVFALGLCSVIVQESLYDKVLANTYANGFDAFKRYVLAEFSPKKVSDSTGVDPAVVIATARDFARAKKPLAVCGRGQGDSPGALGEFVAVHALNALVGNINQAGGVWAVPPPDYVRWEPVNPDATARRGLEQERIDAAGRGLQADALPDRLPGALNDQSPYGLEVLLVSNANPLYSMRDSAGVTAAFDNIGLIVNFSSHFDETVRYSDLILPNHTYLERYEDVASAGFFHKPYIGLCRPVVDPLYDTKHTGQALIETAKAMAGSVSAAFPWPSYGACLRQTLGSRWTALKRKGYWMDAGYAPPDWPEAFQRLPAKFNFSASVFKNPVFVSPQGDADEYPLLLIPYDSIRLSNDAVGNPPFMTKTVSDTVLKGQDAFVEMNPETAHELRLTEGGRAVLTTPVGRAEVLVHLTHRIGPGVIAMPKGLGRSTNDKTISGKGINVNRMIGAVSDPVTGLDAAWGIRAKLAKI